MIPVFENLPSLGWKQKFSGKENTSRPRKLASSVLITPEGNSNVDSPLAFAFSTPSLIGPFCVCICESLYVTSYYELSTFSGKSLKKLGS